jgi:mRNA interferase RelE/StbE
VAYEIVIKKKALKELNALPVSAIGRIVKAINNLAEIPQPEGSKKLVGSTDNLFRIRIGDYRVVYSIDDKVLIIEIRKIGHRKDVYRF